MVIDDFAGIDTLISFGVGGNIDFEHEMTMRGINRVIMLDHTIEQLPREHPYFTWHKKAIGNTDSDTMFSVKGLLEHHQLQAHPNLFLKCDVEDSEWDVIESTPTEIWKQFAQIVIEFHYFEWMTDPARLERMQAAWTKLAETHACVHVHGNNYGPLQLVNGISLPQCLEITYLRRDRAPLAPSWEIFPANVDTPNWNAREDYFLGSFRFF